MFNILLIEIKFSNGKTCGKLTSINEKLYDILVYMYSSDKWAQHKIWWDDIEVCYTKYTYTLLKGRIYGVVSVSEFSKFVEHLFICILLVLLYSLVKTICSVISIFILGNACIGPYCMKIRLPLEESSSTLNCIPYLTKDYRNYSCISRTFLYQFHTQKLGCVLYTRYKYFLIITNCNHLLTEIEHRVTWGPGV